MARARLLLLALVVGLALSVAGRSLLAEDDVAIEDEVPAAPADPAVRMRQAAQEAQKLFEDGKLEEGAALLIEAADEIGRSPEADSLRFGAIQALAFTFVTEGKNQDELQALADALLEQTSNELEEQTRLGAASVHILCANYGRAQEILNAYLEAFPPPSREELEAFEEEVVEQGGAAAETEHPRTLARAQAKQMLESIAFIGKEAPHFELKTLDGRAVSPRDFKGKVLLLDFWATWCGPCRQELPGLKETYEAYHAKGLEVLGLSLDRDEDKLAAFLEAEGITWPQVYLGEQIGELAELYKFEGIPATFLVDRRGIVRWRDLRGERLAAEIERLIEESEQP